MRNVVKWVIIIVIGTIASVLVKVSMQVGSAKLDNKTYNVADWSEKEYGPNKIKISFPFPLQEDFKLQQEISNQINSQAIGKKKLISELHIYTHIDEKSALSMMYGRYNSKVSVDLEGAINGAYERLAQQLGEQIIANPSGGQSIPYIIKPRNISGYEALEADGNVKYKEFQGKAYAIRILAIKLDHSIYQLQYMHPSLSGYIETADSIFSSVKF